MSIWRPVKGDAMAQNGGLRPSPYSVFLHESCRYPVIPSSIPTCQSGIQETIEAVCGPHGSRRARDPLQKRATHPCREVTCADRPESRPAPPHRPSPASEPSQPPTTPGAPCYDASVPNIWLIIRRSAASRHSCRPDGIRHRLVATSSPPCSESSTLRPLPSVAPNLTGGLVRSSDLVSCQRSS